MPKKPIKVSEAERFKMAIQAMEASRIKHQTKLIIKAHYHFFRFSLKKKVPRERAFQEALTIASGGNEKLLAVAIKSISKSDIKKQFS